MAGRGRGRVVKAFRVAALQTRPVFGDVDANVTRALALAEKVDAALYVFPELMTSGDAFASRAELHAMGKRLREGCPLESHARHSRTAGDC